MTISIIGTGYVGLVTGVVFADLGHKVTCIDIDGGKINQLKEGAIPFYEPGLEELVRDNFQAKRLFFTTEYKDAIPSSKVVFICVGTPPQENGEANLTYLFNACEEMAKYLEDFTLITIKSTVPIGIEEELGKIISKNTKANFELASCPEFLKEGSAVTDTKNPDRTIIGTNSQQAADILLDLYKDMPGQKIVCDIKSAQMIKYASNSYLATKISFANTIANLCEKMGANAKSVLEGMGADTRIGPKFLYPGVGYGGSCFPKDISAFISIAKNSGYKFEILEAVQKINSLQIDLFLEKITKELGSLKNKNITILGLAFKPNTDDIREAPAIKIIKKLLEKGVKIKAYDPIAVNNARKIFNSEVIFTTDPYLAVTGSEAMLIITEWNEFKKLDLTKIKRLMKKPLIIDGRNIYDPKKVKALGFLYKGIGIS